MFTSLRKGKDVTDGRRASRTICFRHRAVCVRPSRCPRGGSLILTASASVPDARSSHPSARTPAAEARLTTEIATLLSRDDADIRARWTELYGGPPPKCLRRPLILGRRPLFYRPSTCHRRSERRSVRPARPLRTPHPVRLVLAGARQRWSSKEDRRQVADSA